MTLLETGDSILVKGIAFPGDGILDDFELCCCKSFNGNGNTYLCLVPVRVDDFFMD